MNYSIFSEQADSLRVKASFPRASRQTRILERFYTIAGDRHLRASGWCENAIERHYSLNTGWAMDYTNAGIFSMQSLWILFVQISLHSSLVEYYDRFAHTE